MPLTVSEIRNVLLLPGHGAQVQLSPGFCCEHNCFSSTHARAQWQCLSTNRDVLCTRVGTGSLCAHAFY